MTLEQVNISTDLIQASVEEFWVFGYGSLMWRPDFDSIEHYPALLDGYQRSLCIYSHVYRGTPEAPGLVLGLDEGGCCHGRAFRVSPASQDAVLAYLRAREMVTGVYLEKWLPVLLADGRLVRALVYVADTAHRQYAANLDSGSMAIIVDAASGQAGPNRDYLINTVRHLQEMDICDEGLEAVLALLEYGAIAQ
jgi:cation transport protein ChaC